MRCLRCGYPSLKGEAACPFCGADPSAQRRHWVVAVTVLGAAAAAVAAALLLRG